MPESNKEGGIKARLVVSGFVQGLGYRAYVKQCALRLKVRGTVKNLPDGSVEIYCSAPTTDVYNRFKEMIRSLPDTEIDGIEEYFEGRDGYGNGPDEWLGFNILRDDLSSIEESLEYVVLGGRQMLRKEDQTLEAIKDMHQDLKKDMKEMHHAIKDSVTDMHQDMNERFDWLGERYGEFGETMRSINEKLDTISQLQQDFHEMKGAFIKLTEYLMNKE